MNKGVRKGSLKAGFTIVETLIVLAVTAGLFVAVSATFVGRQNEAEFTHAVQSTQSQIQQAIDQVANGFYPSLNNFTCTGTGGSVTFSAASKTQGTNQGCVFLGKAIQFGNDSSKTQFRIYDVAGLQSATLGSPQPFNGTDAKVVGVNYVNSDAGLFNYSVPTYLEYGLNIKWAQYIDNGGTTIPIGSVGFLMEPGSLDNSSSGYKSGSSQIDLVPMPGTTTAQAIHIAANQINADLNNPGLVVNPKNGVQICFASSGTNQSGLMTIGGTGRQLLVKLDIKGNQTCT